MINFKCAVKKQKIYLPDFPVKQYIVAGSYGSVQLAFTFSPEWNGFVKFVNFDGLENEWYPLIDNKLVIPDKFCDKSFTIRLVGRKDKMTTMTETVEIEVR